VTERSTLASGPDPRCISGRPPSGRPRGTMRVALPTKARLLWVGLVLAGAASAPAAPPNVTLVALTEDGTLITFPAGHPADASTARVTGASGQLVGLDRRPANGRLYALSTAGDVYTVDLARGAATLVSPLTAPFNGGPRP